MRRSPLLVRTGPLVAGLLWFAMAAGPAFGQVSDAAFKDRVEQLVGRLESPKVEVRAAAEKSLIDLGPRALPLLPSKVDQSKTDLVERLDRIGAALKAKEENTNLGAALVTIRGTGIRLTEVMKTLQKQSGNDINDLREANGVEPTNPALDLDIDNKPFYEALDLIAEKAGITYSAYTGDATIGIMANAAMPQAGMPAMAKPLVVYSGPFRVQFKQLGNLRDFTTGEATANAQFDVMWEPRLRPMLLGIKAEGMKVVDDQGKAVAPDVKDEANETGLRAGNCAAEVNINLAAPERSAKSLASLKVVGTVTVPSGMRAFKFPDLSKPGKQKQGDISVELESTEVDEESWKVAVIVSYPEGGEAFASYRQGLFNNRLWLQKADGSRFEHNGGYSNTGSDNGRMGFEYIFAGAPGKPGDHALVYETPAKVVTIPLEFEFKDVPLP